MKFLPPASKRAAFFLLVAGLKLHAQELTLLGGMLPATNSQKSSPIWQLDYRQELYPNLAASVAYINDGHLTDHHRDGTAFEGWAELPLFQNRLTLAAGAGAYWFYDTESLPGGASADVHGTAPVFSLSATAYLSDRWFCRVNYNYINPAHDFAENSLTVGVGFWFGQDKKPTPGALGDAPDEKGHLTDNELTVFGGQSIVNTFLSEQARAYAVEYRRGVLPHVDWTLSGIYEGDPEIVRRSGIATQGWLVNTFFDDRVSVGVGLGPYVYLDKKHPADAGRLSPAAVAPLVSFTVATQLSEHWLVRMVFDRVTTNYNRDSDIFLLGLGYSWPR